MTNETLNQTVSSLIASMRLLGPRSTVGSHFLKIRGSHRPLTGLLGHEQGGRKVEQESVLRRQARAEAAVRIESEVGILRAAGVSDPYQLPCYLVDEILAYHRRNGLRGIRGSHRAARQAHHRRDNSVWR